MKTYTAILLLLLLCASACDTYNVEIGKVIPLNFALDFDGIDDYVEVADNTAINAIGTGNFTFEVWVKALESEQGIRPQFISNRLQPGVGFSIGFRTSVQSGAHMFPHVQLNNGGYSIFYQQKLLDGLWHHFAVTKAGGTLTFYGDGQIIGSFTRIEIAAASITTPSSLFIGRDRFAPAFDGMIDDLCIWKLARTPSQIQADMRGSLTGREPGLVACWAMNEGQGQITGDSVAGQDGRLGSNAGGDVADPRWNAANH